MLLFLLYLAYLCILFHARDHKMLDQAITFDQWWYFHHRLSEGVLAQWDPFTLLGKIAVQWNCMPLSIMFSPFLVFSELTLDAFHLISIVGTFLSLSVLYLVGRFLGYDRFISLLPVVLMITGGYRYWASRSLYANLLFFYPLAIVCLLNAIETVGRRAILNYLGCIILLAFAFTSARLENIVYSCAFLLVLFAVLIWREEDRERRIRLVWVGALIVGGALALSAWQLSFLISSTLESSRISNESQIGKLFDPSLLKWTIISIAQQSTLLLVAINVGVLTVAGHCKRLFSGPARGLVKLWATFVVGAGQLVLLKILISLRGWTGLEQTKVFFPPNTHPVYKNFDLIFSWYGFLSIVVVAAIYASMEKELTLKKVFTFWAVVFAGFYVAEYSWHIWPININTHFFFMIPMFACFIPFGAVRLMMHKRMWMLAVLVIFHFIGETGFFYLYEVLGIPWLAPRAALAELPFQVILTLEAVLLFAEELSMAVSAKKLFPSTTPHNIKTATGTVVGIACLVFVFLTMKMFLMPVGVAAVAVDGQKKQKVYLEEFPFPETPIKKGNAPINQTLYEARNNADAVREFKKGVNPSKRAYIDDSVVSWGAVMFYKFLPAYSRTLNTSPVYSSEIPRAMSAIFREKSKIKESPLSKKPHPEMNPVFIGYKFEQSKRKDGEDVFDYINEVMILPHQGNDLVSREIIAEEGSNTPRAFVTRNVVKLDSEADEYKYLEDAIAKGGFLTNRITTSDRRFSETNRTGDAASLDYDLKFEQDKPEHIALSVRTNQNAYLALMDTWSRGWRAYVDGKKEEIYRGYMGTRFIRLEKGDHRVEFRYRVPGLFVCSVISICAWFLVVIAFLVVLSRRNTHFPFNAV